MDAWRLCMPTSSTNSMSNRAMCISCLGCGAFWELQNSITRYKIKRMHNSFVKVLRSFDLKIRLHTLVGFVCTNRNGKSNNIDQRIELMKDLSMANFDFNFFFRKPMEHGWGLVFIGWQHDVVYLLFFATKNTIVHSDSGTKETIISNWSSQRSQ